MKAAGFTMLVLALVTVPASARIKVGMKGPITKVLGFIEGLKKQTEEQAKTEQEEYDKFSCWCEQTLEEKAKEINKLKEQIEKLTFEIMRLAGMSKKLEAEISGYRKEVKITKESLVLLTGKRQTGIKEYRLSIEELEQCIGALEMAINVLAPAGTGASGKGKKGKEARLVQTMQLAGSLKEVLANERVRSYVSPTDYELVRSFVEHTSAFGQGMSSSTGFLEDATQSPFGDYAPQSGQIQGILKEMYDGFCMDLEIRDETEGGDVKEFNIIKEEKETIIVKINVAIRDFTDKWTEAKEKLKTARAELVIAQAALDDAEALFKDTSQGCRDKAAIWAKRSAARSEELVGLEKALAILNSPEAKSVFGSEGELPEKLFLQASPKQSLIKTRTLSKEAISRNNAFSRLSALSKKYKSLKLATVVAELRTGGHFDKVIDMIDKLIGVLVSENKEDEDHKEYCETEIETNEDEKEATEKLIEKTKRIIKKRKDDIESMQEQITSLDDSINATKTQIKELSDDKEEEYKAWQKENEEHLLAIKLIRAAAKTIGKFYEEHGLVELQLGQVLSAKPPPETSFDGDYKAEESKGATGVMAILEMLAEDLERSIGMADTEEKTSLAVFVTSKKGLQKDVENDTALRNAVHKEMAVEARKLAYDEADLSQAKLDEEGLKKILKALGKECAWVETHFEKRMDQRGAEIDGLKQAKHILQGAATDEAIAASQP